MGDKFKLHGKYADAVVYTNDADQKTRDQIQKLIDSKTAEGSEIRIMPDCHSGAGCVIGTTMTIKDRVCPNLVGVDLNCGMLVVELDRIGDIDLKRFDECVHKAIPCGFNVFTKQGDIDRNWFYVNGKQPDVLLHELKCHDHIHDVQHVVASLATLGGGNHFIELDKDKSGRTFLVIHSGSRNLGKQVAEIYQDIAIKECNKNKFDRKAVIEDLKKQGRQSEIQATLKKLDSEIESVPDALAYLTGESMKNYLHDVDVCREFAHRNRLVMAMNILNEYFSDSFAPYKNAFIHDKVIVPINGMEYPWHETLHNYIDTKNMILRKGSISAENGELVIIPMNMRDGSLLCVGKGNKDWNYSGPHGAGRIMSRSQAKANLKLDDYKKSMNGIYSSTVQEGTIDEAPMVYKPMDEIIRNIEDTVGVYNIIKPIYNFKAVDDSEPAWMKNKKK